ncbi:MAG: PDZ domain-containing protein [Oscillospiraceae bacterium]|nr:PDZ domain-containing protein [Oscillospiraceae bacterium]
MRLGQRLLYGILRFFHALFSIPIKLKYVLLALLLVGGGTFFYTRKTIVESVGGKEDYNEAMRYIEIKDVVDEEFIDEVDRDAMGASAAAAMISGLGDKWSYFMSPNEYKAYQLSSSNEYSGIGMAILKEDSGAFEVMSVNMDSPAAWAGLTAGMVITSVDGTDVTGLTLDEARTLIRSKLNGKFTLGVGRGGKELIEVDCTGVYQSSVSYRLEKTLAGYIQIANFEAGTADDAINAVEDLLNQGAIALCIDLRGNPGGLDTEVAKLLDYLLPNGVLFIQRDKNGHEKVTESDGMCIQLPMAVLINGETYGEAEVCAAALKEFQWATVIGEPTTGKTRTQETIDLSDGSAIRLSTGTYLTGNRVDISATGGVAPEYIIHNSDASATGTTAGTTGESTGTGATSNDEQLMHALKLLS